MVKEWTNYNQMKSNEKGRMKRHDKVVSCLL